MNLLKNKQIFKNNQFLKKFLNNIKFLYYYEFTIYKNT